MSYFYCKTGLKIRDEALFFSPAPRPPAARKKGTGNEASLASQTRSAEREGLVTRSTWTCPGGIWMTSTITYSFLTSHVLLRDRLARRFLTRIIVACKECDKLASMQSDWTARNLQRGQVQVLRVTRPSRYALRVCDARLTRRVKKFNRSCAWFLKKLARSCLACFFLYAKRFLALWVLRLIKKSINGISLFILIKLTGKLTKNFPTTKLPR